MKVIVCPWKFSHLVFLNIFKHVNPFSVLCIHSELKSPRVKTFTLHIFKKSNLFFLLLIVWFHFPLCCLWGLCLGKGIKWTGKNVCTLHLILFWWLSFMYCLIPMRSNEIGCSQSRMALSHPFPTFQIDLDLCFGSTNPKYFVNIHCFFFSSLLEHLLICFELVHSAFQQRLHVLINMIKTSFITFNAKKKKSHLCTVCYLWILWNKIKAHIFTIFINWVIVNKSMMAIIQTSRFENIFIFECVGSCSCLLH